jgi:hypothetical protein
MSCEISSGNATTDNTYLKSNWKKPEEDLRTWGTCEDG